MEELPSRFVLAPLEDETPPLADGTELAEPLGDAAAIVPNAEGTGDPAAAFSPDEYADLIATPGSEQRIAEAPRAQHGEIIKALLTKQQASARALADSAARDALARGKEEGRNELAKELLVRHVDGMEAYERNTFFQDPVNAGAEQLWHQSKAQVPAPQPQAAFVQQIAEQGNYQLSRLTGSAEYQPVYDEMVQGKYAADPAGLAALAARVERALATKAPRDDAEATAKNRAAALLKSSPKTVGVGMGGAAAAGPLTVERMQAMTPAEALEFMNTHSDGIGQIARATQELSKSLA